ncbi:hypothetical protein LX32DRAFT_296588 [Colletotrichum zoysiae]|uniref:Uncharacterized protein n=1 Tax=Colletotrichum zoysiae TaxID=1216348 RepID=A0AAD9HL95_9PEZI|nr:hypothetical protein LX32DRAFT_296588 [Colletotrichum zoysiae]
MVTCTRVGARPIGSCKQNRWQSIRADRHHPMISTTEPSCGLAVESHASQALAILTRNAAATYPTSSLVLPAPRPSAHQSFIHPILPTRVPTAWITSRRICRASTSTVAPSSSSFRPDPLTHAWALGHVQSCSLICPQSCYMSTFRRRGEGRLTRPCCRSGRKSPCCGRRLDRLTRVFCLLGPLLDPSAPLPKLFDQDFERGQAVTATRGKGDQGLEGKKGSY